MPNNYNDEKIFIFPTSNDAVKHFWKRAIELARNECHEHSAIDFLNNVRVKFAELVSHNARKNHDEDHQHWIDEKNRLKNQVEKQRLLIQEFFPVLIHYSKTENSNNTDLANELLKKYFTPTEVVSIDRGEQPHSD